MTRLDFANDINVHEVDLYDDDNIITCYERDLAHELARYMCSEYDARVYVEELNNIGFLVKPWAVIFKDDDYIRQAAIIAKYMLYKAHITQERKIGIIKKYRGIFWDKKLLSLDDMIIKIINNPDSWQGDDNNISKNFIAGDEIYLNVETALRLDYNYYMEYNMITVPDNEKLVKVSKFSGHVQLTEKALKIGKDILINK